MTTTALQMPVNTSDVETRGPRLFRKQILKPEKIDYKGRRLNFDHTYLSSLVDAFNQGAYDQVPLQLANDANQHNEDPKNFAGEVKGLELADDGLYGLIELTDDGARLVRDNPRLGVSARIVEDLAKSDGRAFPRAIRHVLATLDPVVTGLKGWETAEVSLSADLTDVPVIDLTETGSDNNRKESGMDPAKIREALGLAADASDEDVTAKLAEAGFTPKPAPSSNDDSNTDDDAKLEAALRELLDDKESAGAALSAEQQAAIDLANSRAEEAQATARTLATQLAQQSFASYKTELVGKGVPPVLVDLAAPVLSLPGTTVIDLSNDGGEKVDVTAILRSVLEHPSVRTVDLSNPRGYEGNDQESDDDKKIQATLEAWEKQYPAKR